MTDLDIIERAQQIMGGKITYRGIPNGSKKVTYLIRKHFQPIDGIPIMNLIHQMWPLLGYRRQEQIINVIEKQKQIKQEMGVTNRGEPYVTHSR